MYNKEYHFNQACVDGDLQIVKALINDPDVNPSDRDNLPIRLAADNGHKDIVELLMQDSRVDPSDRDNLAIRWASSNGHKEVVRLLLTDKRVMDKIEVALNGCKERGGYELLKGCVDKHKRESDVWELIEQMEKDADMWF